MTKQSIPFGFCQCGCGQQTTVATMTNKKIGHVKGKPIRYLTGHNTRRSPVDYIEEDRGYDTLCWIWQRHIDPEGYGRVQRKEYQGTAHKWCYIVHIGPVAEGLHLDHLCRVRECVNPDHLEPVTPAINARRSAATKLTATQIVEIRGLYQSGNWLQRELADHFGVTRSAIKHIVTGEGWRKT